MRATSLLREAVNTFGSIERVSVHLFDRAFLSAVLLSFETGVVLVEAVADDDTLRVSLVDQGEFEWLDASTEEPWKQLVGGRVLWFWTLENQQGYEDGLQLMVRSGAGDYYTLQLITEASELQPAVVERA